MNRIISPLRKATLLEKTFALAQYYANRDGHQWYVVQRAPIRENKIELLDRHPGPGNYKILREFLPRRRDD